jgi:hypothetical protein
MWPKSGDASPLFGNPLEKNCQFGLKVAEMAPITFARGGN